jgi:L-glyceraldehyde 3-phosphate reductase
LHGIPGDSRAGKPHGFLRPEHITDEKLARVRLLGNVAASRGQSIAQMALAWVLRHSAVTSAVIGASSVKQIEDNVAIIPRLEFSADELHRIDEILR